MKVAELEGALLDHWVARAQGIQGIVDMMFMPSTDWATGGPIIERERISIKQGPDRGCYAYFDHRDETAAGNTPLVAAMRAYVASKFGEEVRG